MICVLLGFVTGSIACVVMIFACMLLCFFLLACLILCCAGARSVYRVMWNAVMRSVSVRRSVSSGESESEKDRVGKMREGKLK